jgi:hypothetical protein
VQTTLNISFYNCVARLAPQEDEAMNIESFGLCSKHNTLDSKDGPFTTCQWEHGMNDRRYTQRNTHDIACIMRTPYRLNGVCVAHRWKYHVC